MLVSPDTSLLLFVTFADAIFKLNLISSFFFSSFSYMSSANEDITFDTPPN